MFNIHETNIYKSNLNLKEKEIKNPKSNPRNTNDTMTYVPNTKPKNIVTQSTFIHLC